MSRRNHSGSPLRFTDRREVRDSLRHDDIDFGRHGNDNRAREYDRDTILRDDRNKDTRPRDERSLDRHGQYHQAILREDILDPDGADIVSDRYDDRGYDAGSYPDRRQHYDDLHLDSYGERTYVEDRYTADTYETRNSYQVDRYDRNDSEVRYSDHGDRIYDDNYRSDVNTNNDAYYGHQDEGHSRSYDRDRDRLDDSRIVNDRFKAADSRHHAVAEDFTNARDNRVNRQSRDITRNNVRKGNQTNERFGGSSNKFAQPSRVMDTSNKQKKPKETTVHSRYDKQLSGQKHVDARIIRKGDLRPDNNWNSRGATNKTNKTDSFDKKKPPSRIGEKTIKGSDKKTSGVSKASVKTTNVNKSEKPHSITSSKRDAEKVGNRDIKVTQTNKGTTKTTNSRSGQSEHSNRSRERTIKTEPERKRNTSSGDRRERKNTESARESSSRSNIAKGSYEGDHRVSRQRSSGGGVENKDEGVYHDDDVLSILADDDRFDRETRGMSDFSSRKEGSRDNRPSQRDNRKQSGDRFTSRSDNCDLQKQAGDVRRSKTDLRSDRPLKQSYTPRTNNWNNNRQFGKTGFYKKKTGFSTQFPSHGKGRFSKFVGERAKETRSSEADNKFGRKQASYVNQESNKTWNHEAVGKKSVFNRGNGNVSSTIRSSYKSNRGFGYKSRFMGKPGGFKNDSFRKNYLDNGSKRKGRDGYVNQNHSDYAGRQQLVGTDNMGYMGGEQGREGNFNDNFVGDGDRNADLSEQGQQIIFIPNADYPGNVDSYGNVMKPDQGGISQVPYQMLPSNMAPSDNPQGSEQLIFIPFVNNQLQADSAVPVQLNSDGQIQMPEFKPEDDKNKNGMAAQKKLIGKGLSAKKRALLRKKLIAKRRQRLEQEIEKKVLKKLLGNSGNTNLASNTIKKGIKRISPPARGTGKPRSKRQVGLEDVSDEYDDVSDLESVSEEEDGNPRRRGGQRKAFRKPGEPRANQITTIQSGQDVRRVVEKNAEKDEDDSRGNQRGRKRTVYEVHGNQGSVKFMKTNERKYERGNSTGRQDIRGPKSMSPLQITVNNDKFSSSGNRNKGKGTDAREKIDARANRGQQGRYTNIKGNPRGNGRDSADMDDYENDESDWKKGKYIDNENNQGRGKKQSGNDNGHSKSHSEESWNERRRNQPKHWSDDGDRPNSSQSQSFNMKDKHGIQQGLFVSNQGLINQSQSLSAQQPFQQSVLGSQTQQLAGSLQPNISLVTGGNSIDPSLPPVMNIPQLSQSNLMLHPDMSLPPPQVSMMGSQNSLSQLAYQPALPSQAVLSLQNQLLQSNHQLQQATIQQHQQQLMQLQQQALLGNRNQLDNSTAIINNSGGMLNNSPGLGQSMLSNIQQNTGRGLQNSGVSIQGSDRVLQSRGGSLFQDNSAGTSTLNLNNQQGNQQAGIHDRQLLQNQGSQQQSIDSLQNLGSQIQLGQMQTPNSIVTTLQHSSGNLSLSSANVNSISRSSAGTQHQGVRGVLGTFAKGTGSTLQNTSISKSAQNIPLMGSYHGQMNETGQGIGTHFKGQQFLPKGSSNNSYDNKGNTSNSFSNKSRFENDSSMNKSMQVVSNSQYGKNDRQHFGGRSAGNQNRYDQGRTTSQDRYDHGNQQRWTNKERNEQGRSANQENTFQGRAANQNRSFQGRSANQNRYEQGNTTNQERFTQGRPANQDRFAHGRVNNQGSRPEGYQINVIESDEESDDDDVGQLLCTKCDKVYLSKRVMRKHGLWHDRSSSGHFDLSCDRCELAFSTAAALNTHIDEKHKLEAWNCQYCDVSFPYSTGLLRHLQRDNHFSLRKMFVCPTCPEQFGSVKLLAHHKQTHSRRTGGY